MWAKIDKKWVSVENELEKQLVIFVIENWIFVQSRKSSSKANGIIDSEVLHKYNTVFIKIKNTEKK